MSPTVPESIPENTSRNTHNVVAELLLARCPAAGTVLDIPCGAGAFTKRLLDRGVPVVSGDVVDGCLDPRAQFRVCNMNERLPFGDGELTAVVCIDGIEHIERPFDFISECARIVRRDGWLILSTPNISALRSRWRYLMTGFHNKGKSPLDETRPCPLQHINLLSFPQLRYMLHSRGFRIETIRCNRIKTAAWLYAPLAPPAALMMRLVFRREEDDPAQRVRNQDIARQMATRQVCFGETLILAARRT